jgi:dihydrofolate synthase/folylpolyglutamate synthase
VTGFEKAFAALKGLTNYETMVRPPYDSRAMNLPRTRALLRRLGDPQRSFPTLQVAGTKGKGTTATALAAMLRAAGYRVGLYTSPHLFHVRERFRVDGEWIPDEEFASCVEEMLVHVEPLRGTRKCPTFFELVTALAILWFAKRGVDAGVLEVGLGGRLDATSAVPHLASVVTQVGLDHQAVLGSTKTRIAAEKAGVARRGVPLVSGVPASTSHGRVVIETAAARRAPILLPGRDFRIATGSPAIEDGRAVTPVRVKTLNGAGRSFRPAVLGRMLARDAGLAVVTLSLPRVRRTLPVDADAMARGLRDLRVPGRMQVVPGTPPILVDGAHNLDSAKALAATIADVLPSRKLVAVLGGGLDKGIPSIAAELTAIGRPIRFVFTRPATHPRAADPRELARSRRGARSAPDLGAALAIARRLAGPRDLILVSGSLYLAGEALAHLGVTPSG